MNKLSIICCFLLIVGCATHQSSLPLQPQEVKISISAAEPASVNVDTTESINKSMTVENPEVRLSSLSFLAGGKAFSMIFSGLSVSDVTRLWTDICYLENLTAIREINLFINSPGGDAFTGLALADQIERAQKKGFKITAYASGIVASAAVPVFAVCNQRCAAQGTIFMVHEAALWKWPGRETASDIRSQNELMHLLRERYIGKLVANSKLSKDEWERLEKNTTWFSAEQALEWGIVDKIE